MTITLRTSKGVALTHTELDGNFSDLNSRVSTVENRNITDLVITAISDLGGDGSITYNSGTGVITYAGPSASEVRSHFTPGTGISILNGAIALDFGEFNTSNITENTNLYYTNARADARIAAANLSDLLNVHTTAPTNGQVLTWDNGNSRWAPAASAGGSGVLSVATQAVGTAALAYNSGTGVFAYTPPDLSGYLSTSDFNTSFTAKSTTDLSEGTNLYHTSARADARADARIAAATTTDLTEGTNLYYTNARADARINLQTGSNLDISSKTTDALSEGSTNLYYTNTRADARIAAATTTDLTEGTNLYFTNSRADARIAAATTDNLSEGTSLYYTNSRADARISAATGANLDISQVCVIQIS